MKSWFAKFRISNALDAEKPLPKSLEHRMRASEELRRYAAGQAHLVDALKRAGPQIKTPPDLHRAIMGAVGVSRRSLARQPLRLQWRWLAPAGAAALLLIGMLWFHHRPTSPVRVDGVPSVTLALESGPELAQTIPAVVTAPLSDELARLNADLGRTEQFLLANLPSADSVRGEGGQ